jgi:uncharacterized protein YcbX
MARVVSISYYPIKGCAAVSVKETELTSAGPRHDRSFVVVTAGGICRTQRRTPALAVIRPELRTDGTVLRLRAPGVETLETAVDTGPLRRQVLLFGVPYPAIDQGDVVAEWLSDVLGSPSRLARVPPEHVRETDGLTKGTAAFADGQAVTVITESSLDALNERILEHGGDPVPMDRFRPNIVVRGWPRPHTEDRIRRMTVGGAELGYAKLDIRCAVTMVDQETGAKSGPEPLRTLAGYRRTAEGGVAFGIKAAVTRAGKVAVGDEALVTAWEAAER